MHKPFEINSSTWTNEATFFIFMYFQSISGSDFAQVSSNDSHVLTYEDKEGDWMMVGDVPWE